MNESTTPIVELENKIKLLIGEFKILKEKNAAQSSSITTSNKLARVEEKIKNIIEYLDEL